jgi:hypothetical protein
MVYRVQGRPRRRVVLVLCGAVAGWALATRPLRAEIPLDANRVGDRRRANRNALAVGTG